MSAAVKLRVFVVEAGGIMRTYAMQVTTGSEDRTVELIGRVLGAEVGRDCFVPRLRFEKKVKGSWTTVAELLTPGYVYLRSHASEVTEISERLRRVPAFTKLLAVDGRIVPLSQDEVAWLHALTGDDYVVEPSIGVMEGDRIVIVRGPLKGLEAQIRKIDRHKRIAYVEGRLFGRPNVIKVGLEVVSKGTRVSSAPHDGS